MDHQYEMLVKILDRLCLDAPSSYKTYYPDGGDAEALTKARSLAFIHLLLKVKFGLTEFMERHQRITDGPQDGGLDAFYIDEERKRLFMIQAKFRASAQNFKQRSMKADELIRMEVTRITKGYTDDSNGNAYNSKIRAFQEQWRGIRDVAKYEYIVLFLGNVNTLNDDQIRKLIDNCEYETYDASAAYEKLIFPLASGTYYDPDEIIIRLELVQKKSPRLEQIVDTDFGQYNVTAIFVPIGEIGRVMSRYKNAILKYNPRNFLSLQKKSVNENIRKSVLDQEKNNFAILNNGITILADNVSISESTGRTNEGQLILTKPQILNGGQTAYTLSTVYEEYHNKPENPLRDKEVLLKIITPVSASQTVKTDFIELISNATNQQNEVSEADRRSNHDIQVALQKQIYSHYGYFYERKAGEFHDGINGGIIDQEFVIDRLTFIKAYWAYLGEPAAARRTSEKFLFKEGMFYAILKNMERFSEMFFAYILFNEMQKLERTFGKKSDSTRSYGYSLLYGKWAVVASIGITKPTINSDSTEIFAQATETVRDRLSTWSQFDDFVRMKRSATKYFAEGTSNYELYYKVNMLDEDVREYFLK
ncbi:MAG: hypothetical protein A2Y77_15700 [Planctomycetes bacterium RBG_13_62_9]|nr:MAG: hypothetical protein A2Y77_15700 [Planctomycetes bacterium RBG_13_62_9]